VIRFYDVEIETQSHGSVLGLHEPAFKGTVVASIAGHGGRRRLYACVCGDGEHAQNLSLPNVGELGEEAAAQRAAEYQPACDMPIPDPATGEVQTVHIPACDLRHLLSGGNGGAIGGQLLGEEPA
jgi:hypothetical protein